MSEKTDVLSEIDDDGVVEGLSRMVNNNEVEGPVVCRYLRDILHAVSVPIHDAALEFVA